MGLGGDFHGGPGSIDRYLGKSPNRDQRHNDDEDTKNRPATAPNRAPVIAEMDFGFVLRLRLRLSFHYEKSLSSITINPKSLFDMSAQKIRLETIMISSGRRRTSGILPASIDFRLTMVL